MVKIIDKEPHKSVVKEAICKHCGVTLSYVPNDVTEEFYADYSGCRESYYYIECVNCSKKVEV